MKHQRKLNGEAEKEKQPGKHQMIRPVIMMLSLIHISFMDAGGLVPDEITIGMLLDRIHEADCVNGYVLDLSLIHISTCT